MFGGYAAFQFTVTLYVQNWLVGPRSTWRWASYICQLATPGSSASEIEDNELSSYLPAALQDACTHWVAHVKKDEFILHDGSAVYKFCREHFLHWLEALSLMGRTAEGISMVTELESMVSVSLTKLVQGD